MKNLIIVIALTLVSLGASAQIFVHKGVGNIMIITVDSSNIQYILDEEKKSANLIVDEVRVFFETTSGTTPMKGAKLVLKSKTKLSSNFVLSVSSFIAELHLIKRTLVVDDKPLLDPVEKEFLKNFE